MDKDHVNNEEAVEDNSVDKQKSSDASNDIKKEMHKYEEKIKSGEAPEGDTTRAEE